MPKTVGRRTTQRVSGKARTAATTKTKPKANPKPKKRQAKTPLLPVMVLSGSSAALRTKAATMLAKELKSPLHRIDLGKVVSHTIGETEENLNRVLEKAERSDAILFFDEADALFEKRSAVKDGHDRFAHLDVKALLRRLEQHEGLTILATNQQGPLDKRLQKYLHVPLGRVPAKKPRTKKKLK